MVINETKSDLLKDLNLSEEETCSSLETIALTNHRYLRDLRINLKNVLSAPELTPKESYLLALAVAVNEKNEKLKYSFTTLAKLNGATDEEISETHACASMLATNNVFYRFRHFTKNNNDKYQTIPAGIKMNIMMNPILGKEFFELMSLVISAVNGCEQCVNSHEQSVRNLGSSETRIFNAIRLASVVRGLSSVIN